MKTNFWYHSPGNEENFLSCPGTLFLKLQVEYNVRGFRLVLLVFLTKERFRQKIEDRLVVFRRCVAEVLVCLAHDDIRPLLVYAKDDELDLAVELQVLECGNAFRCSVDTGGGLRSFVELLHDRHHLSRPSTASQSEKLEGRYMR